MHPKNKLHRFKISLTKAKKRIGFWWDDVNKEWEKTRLQALRHTTKLCSCPGCGNPRHNLHEKEKMRITMQERRANLDMEEQLKEK